MYNKPMQDIIHTEDEIRDLATECIDQYAQDLTSEERSDLIAAVEGGRYLDDSDKKIVYDSITQGMMSLRYDKGMGLDNLLEYSTDLLIYLEAYELLVRE